MRSKDLEDCHILQYTVQVFYPEKSSERKQDLEIFVDDNNATHVPSVDTKLVG